MEITDAIRILRFLFLGDPERLECGDASDADDNGEIQITDAAYLLPFLYQGSAPPPEPFPRCGNDATTDNLDCAAYPQNLPGLACNTVLTPKSLFSSSEYPTGHVPDYLGTGDLNGDGAPDVVVCNRVSQDP